MSDLRISSPILNRSNFEKFSTAPTETSPRKTDPDVEPFKKISQLKPKPFSAITFAENAWKALGSFFMSEAYAAEDVPPQNVAFAHQGRLLDGNDAPVNGAHQMKFRIYDFPVKFPNEQALWEQEYTVQVVNGVYAVTLGDTDEGRQPLPTSFFPVNEERYLTVSIDGEAEMEPRLRIGLLPYAAVAIKADQANNAAKLGGELPDFYRDASNLNAGTLASDRLSGTYSQQLAFDNALNTYTGDGSALTNVHAVTAEQAANAANSAKLAGELPDFYRDASNLNAGTLPSDRLSGIYSQQLAFPNALNTYSGSGAGLTNLPWDSLTGFPAACPPGQYASGVGGALACSTPPDTGLAGSGTSNYVSKFTGENSIGNSFIFDNGTNVGVGTTSPAVKLDVAGAIRPGAANDQDCATGTAGALRWSGGSIQVCDGTGWRTLQIVQPLIFSVVPNSGSITGGTPITINGSNFVQGASVLVGNTPATNIVLASAVQITAKTPQSSAIEPKDLKVSNPDGAFYVLPNAFTYFGDGSSQALAAPSCKAIKDSNNSATDGSYWIDPNGGNTSDAFQAVCNMTRDGGGWTLGVKSWYSRMGDGSDRTSGTVGSIADALTRKGNIYKLSDDAIRAIIGPNQNFDIMGDQNGYNSSYSSGNYEYVIVRNYTARWSWVPSTPASTTTTTMQSYRISDNALAWTGNLACGKKQNCTDQGNRDEAGINCYDVISNSPQGGAGCSINMGSRSDGGWHHFFMSECNTDTYLYICNGAQHSSSHDMNHRWWFRQR